MSRHAPPTIVNVGHRSTNYWVISAGRSRLLVDLGWPGRVEAMLHALARADIPLGELRAGVATHYHLDHAGAAQDLKVRGMPLLVLAPQVPFIPLMKRHAKPADQFTDIALHDNLVIPCEASRAWLAEMGLHGEIVATPGHSDDSVSLVLDSGEVFTGDLTPEGFADEAAAPTVRASWDRLRALGGRRVHPGHGPVVPMPAPPT